MQRLTERHFADLIGEIYSGLFDPAACDRFLQTFAGLYSGSGGIIAQTRVGAAAICAPVGIDPQSIASYERYYSTRKPWLPILGRVAPLDVFGLEKLIQEPEYRTSEYYNDWLRPQEKFYLIGGLIDRNETTASIVTLMRDERCGDFDCDEREFCRLLLPHLRHALRVRSQLTAAASQQAGLLAGFDNLAIGIVASRRDGAVVHANRTAETIFRERDGLWVEHGLLRAAQHGTASGSLIRAGGLEIVSAGGSEDSASISGTIQIYTGGHIANATVYAGGFLEIGLFGFGGGGTADSTTVMPGALEFVSAGGIEIGASISGDDQAYGNGQVYVGGRMVAATVHSRGLLQVGLVGYGAGGMVLDTTIESAGDITVESAGVASDTAIKPGGLEIVSSAGTDIGATLSGNSHDFGTAQVYAGGVMSGVRVGSRGLLQLGLSGFGAGGTAIDTVIDTGGLDIVNSGGVDIGASVAGGAQVFSGGLLSAATVHNSGVLLLGVSGFGAGGTASGTLIEHGALEIVSSGGVDLDGSISGQAQVYAGGTLSGATVFASGTLDIGLSSFGRGGAAIDTTILGGATEFCRFRRARRPHDHRGGRVRTRVVGRDRQRLRDQQRRHPAGAQRRHRARCAGRQRRRRGRRRRRHGDRHGSRRRHRTGHDRRGRARLAARRRIVPVCAIGTRERHRGQRRRLRRDRQRRYGERHRPYAAIRSEPGRAAGDCDRQFRARLRRRRRDDDRAGGTGPAHGADPRRPG